MPVDDGIKTRKSRRGSRLSRCANKLVMKSTPDQTAILCQRHNVRRPNYAETPTVIVSDFNHRHASLDPASEGALLALTIPCRDPFIWANGGEILLEIFTWCIILTLDLLATVIVNIVLPA